MNFQPRVEAMPPADVEFLESRHYVTKTVTVDADFVRTGQYEANKKILKAGTILGKISATGLYAPVKKTTLAAAAAATDTVITVADAQFFQAGDAINVDGTTATISSVNYSTNQITLTAALGVAKSVGATVKATNGLGDADCILLNSVDVTDGDAAVAAITHGVVYEARVKGANAATKADLRMVEFR